MAAADFPSGADTARTANLPGSFSELPVALTRFLTGIFVAWPERHGQGSPVWVVVTAGLSPALTTAGWLAAGALQPASYSPLRQTVSVLAGHAGTDRWIMTTALFLVGGCYLATATGLAGVRLPARLLLIVAGLASIGIAANPEPAGGSTPWHLAWTALGAVTITAWPAVAAWRPSIRPPVLTGRNTAIVTIAFITLLGWLIVQTQGGSDLGLAERIASAVQTSWPFIVALALRGTSSQPGKHQHYGKPPTGSPAQAPAVPTPAEPGKPG